MPGLASLSEASGDEAEDEVGWTLGVEGRGGHQPGEDIAADVV